MKFIHIVNLSFACILVTHSKSTFTILVKMSNRVIMAFLGLVLTINKLTGTETHNIDTGPILFAQ